MLSHRSILVCAILTVGICIAWQVLRTDQAPADAAPEPQTIAENATAAELEPKAQAAAQPESIAPTSLPKALAQKREHDFGTVDPFQAYTHRFEVQNNGTANLALVNPHTNCKCLKVEVSEAVVFPGETGFLVCTWDADASQDLFLQRASVSTNDPANSILEFVVQGKARLTLAAEPAELTAPRIQPNQETHLETKIVSQVWSSFQIDEVQPSIAGATWKLLPIDSGELAKMDMKAGWRLVVTLPTGLPTGNLKGSVVVKARPTGENPANLGQPIERAIPLEGNVLRGLAVYGKDVTTWGTIQAGTIDPVKGYEASLTVKVNDAETRLNVIDMTVSPSFVDVRLEPFSETERPGLYRLTVRIPPSEVPAAYVGDKRGKLLLLFDHPRIEQLDLGLEFIVKKPLRNGLERRTVTAVRTP